MYVSVVLKADIIDKLQEDKKRRIELTLSQEKEKQKDKDSTNTTQSTKTTTTSSSLSVLGRGATTLMAAAPTSQAGAHRLTSAELYPLDSDVSIIIPPALLAISW